MQKFIQNMYRLIKNYVCNRKNLFSSFPKKNYELHRLVKMDKKFIKCVESQIDTFLKKIYIFSTFTKKVMGFKVEHFWTQKNFEQKKILHIEYKF